MSTAGAPPNKDPSKSFDDLPIELNHQILSYLLGPQSAFTTGTRSTGVNSRIPSLCVRAHPFYQLAATSHNLKDLVEGYCQHLVRIHSDIVKLPKKYHAADQKDLVWRSAWIKWAKGKCQFCGRNTQRKAIFNNALLCCKECDRKEWNAKITMTNALKRFDLKRSQLFEHPRHPRSALYYCSGVKTTMFLTPEVERFAMLIHGDLSEHLDERNARRIERRKKTEDKKAAQLDAQKNNLIVID